MYVNPFERMRKKSESEEKAKERTEKERQKYARLTEQMGFTQKKGVLPSFIKGLIGDEHKKDNYHDEEQLKENLFDGGLDDNYENTKTINIDYKDFDNQQNLKPNYDRDSKTEHFADFKKPVFEETTQSYSNRTDQHQVEKILEHIIASNKNETKTLNWEKNAFLDNDFENNSAKLYKENSNAISVNPKVYTSQYSSLTPIKFIEQLVSNEIDGNLFGVIEKDSGSTLLDIVVNGLPRNLNVVINVQEVFQYENPDLFLLKQIIKKLPIISLEDKQVLWEKTSLCLSATEFGKTGTDLDQLIKEVGITNPVKMIAAEFESAFEAYQLEKQSIPIIIKNFSQMELSEIIPILKFIEDVFNEVHVLKFILQIDEIIMEDSEKFQIVKELINNFDAFIVENPQQIPIVEDDFFKISDDLELTKTQELLDFTNKPIIHKNKQVESDFWDDSDLYENQREYQNVNELNWKEPIVENRKLDYNSNYTKKSKKIVPHSKTVNVYSQIQKNFLKEENNSELLAEQSLRTKKDLLNKNSKISIDLNLKRQADEIARREKDEEIQKLQKINDMGFRPEILADDNNSKININVNNRFSRYQNDYKQAQKDRHKTLNLEKRINVNEKLNQLNEGLENVANLNIQDNFAKRDLKKQNKNIISIPGRNWSNLK